MKRKWLNAVSTLALAFVMLLLPIFSTVDGSKQTKDYVDYTTQTRTINADESIIDFESIFNEYEDAKIETDGSLTTFEGRQVLNLADLDELDEVSKQELEGEQLNIKYKYSFDYVTDKVTLTAVSIIDTENGEIQEEIIDTVEGTAFINEAGNIDAVLNIDGEEYLLSELQDAGMVENCGLFKKIFKAIKKVTKTVVGVVGAIATVAVPAVIGVVGAMTGLGLVATIAIGAVAGATIATATSAASTAQQNNGKVDWKTVGVCAGVGAVVGAVVSGAAYGITKAVQAAKAAKSAKAAEDAAKAAEEAAKATKADLGNKLDYAFGKAGGNAHNINRSMQNASQLSKIGIYDDAAGREILTEHFNKALADNSTQILAQNAGRVKILTLLSGPGGFMNVESVWEGVKLITFIFIG